MPRNDSQTGNSAPPIANSYWVEPGRLLAGEYPGRLPAAEAAARIQRLLDAGVNTFIDLTQAGELPTYFDSIRDAQPRAIEHHRWPIVDHSVPVSAQYMSQILDAVDAALAQGRCVYVHCHAGIGRTGTTIGCYLIRKGLTGDQALEHLQQLWRQCARSERWPTIPETDAQYGFVRTWSEPVRLGRQHAALTWMQRCEGAFFGLAVGDGLGLLLAKGYRTAQQLRPESFAASWQLEAGTQLLTTLAALESLDSRSGHDPDDQMQRYLQAYRANPQLEWSADFKRALAAWQWSGKAVAGTHDPSNVDAHSLARCLAAAAYAHTDAMQAVDLAVELSRTTQQSPVVLDACRLWTAVLSDALSGVPATQLLDGPAAQSICARGLRIELEPLLQRQWSSYSGRDAGALSACAHALLAVQNTPDFASGMLRVLDEPQPGVSPALQGALAGAHYGVEAVPAVWRRVLRSHAQVTATLARRAS